MTSTAAVELRLALLTLRVPIGPPGATVPPPWTVTAELTVPIPASVAPLSTWVPDEEVHEPPLKVTVTPEAISAGLPAVMVTGSLL